MDPRSPQHDFDTEAALARQAQEGDRAAFDRLAGAYRPALFALARRHAAQADPDDLVQETLLRAWEKLPGLKDPRAFPAWLTTLAVNLCRRRGAEAVRRPISLDEEGLEWAAAVPDPLDALLRREFSAEVREALLAIPEGNRRALILHLWGQYSYAEIAERLGTPLTTVEGRIHRAKAQLRQRLEFLQPYPPGARGEERTMARQAKRGDQPFLVPQLGHPTGVCDVAVSPDGKRLATGASTGLVILWNLETGRQEAWVDVLTSMRVPLFSPDGRWLAVPDGFRQTLLLDVERGKVARVLDARAWSLAFSPDSTTLITGSWILTPDGDEPVHTIISSFEVATGKPIRRVEGLPGYAVLISRDGSRAVTLSTPRLGEDGLPPAGIKPRLYVWALPGGERVSVLDGLPGLPHGNAAAVSADNTLVAVAACYPGSERDVFVWETETGRVLQTLSGFEEHPVYSMAFHPREPYLVTADEGWRARVWDLSTGQCSRELEKAVRSDGMAFFPDGTRLAGTGGGGVIWDWEGGRIAYRLHSYRPCPLAAAFSPDGSRLGVAYYFGGVVWDMTAGSLSRRLDSGQNVSRRLLHFTPDGRRVLSVGGQAGATSGTWYDMLYPPSEVFAWETETGGPDRPFPSLPKVLQGLAVSPDGTRAASVVLEPERAPIATGTSGPGHLPRWEGTLTIWNAHTWQAEHELPFDTCPLDGDVVAFSPDGKLLAVGGQSQDDNGSPAVAEITLWSTDDWAVRRRCERTGTGLEAIAFSPDGRVVAAALKASQTRQADLVEAASWDVATGAPGPDYRLVGAQGWASCIRFSPDGKALAAGASDGTLVLWDAATARVRRALRANPGGVNGLDFSPDGSLLATAGSDGLVKLWRVPDLLARGPVREAATLVLAGEGRWLAYTPEGYYECSPDAEELLLWRVGRELLPAERMRERFHHPGRVAAALGRKK